MNMTQAAPPGSGPGTPGRPPPPPAGPPMVPQVDRDQEHLHLLAIFHYIVAALLAVFGCFPIVHLVVGLKMMGEFADSSPMPISDIGMLFVAIAVVMIAAHWVAAMLIYLSANRIRQRRALGFCTVVAAITCIFMPLGTVLGIFTIIVLQRRSVRAMFRRA
jgi:hypothetical protein